jgi:hypothetical protein
MTEKVGARGLARLAAWIFFAWGAVLALKGLYDAFLGQPEANYYSPKPWQYVTREQWFRWVGFEIAYGAACLGLGLAALEYAKRLPVFVLREKKEETI